MGGFCFNRAEELTDERRLHHLRQQVVVKWRQFLTSGDQDATSQSARMSRKIGCFANRYTGLADKELSALYHYLNFLKGHLTK